MLKDFVKDATILNSYKESAEKTKVFFSHPFEVVAGFIPGKEPQEIIEIWKSIKPCTCGSNNLIVRVDETMGDWDCAIECQDCGRRVLRSMYDYDVTKDIDEITLCITDWNKGLNQEAIDKNQKQEQERKQLKSEDLIWSEVYPNNIVSNGLEGYCCKLFTQKEDGLYCCKWSIIFQHKELEPMTISKEIESYNLYMKRYFNYTEENILQYDINNYGEFVRNYKTLDKAKEGAVARCGWQGLNKDTVIR